ncbi:hypothetical protein [Nostoc sp. WHI]|uniref:hypothetical protein n=1 Tax=Nostoc sp. WHI TaxID=2650611 RepID=UPI0018C5F361|nr:hypothetical protein [Nostoc sp. WHI]MBG1268708.1 hypothetical protein [Nostoc sp. WHI]
MCEQNYELRTDYWCHVRVCRELGIGAELYDSQDTITIKHGSQVIWWWKPDRQHQQIRLETEALAELFGAISQKPEEFTTDKMSPERLVKAFIRHVLKLPMNKQTRRYGNRYYYLVETRPQLLEMDELAQVQRLDQEHGFNYDLLGNASHWHYLYLAPQPQGYAIELDIESAHFTAFINQQTMLLSDPGEYGQPYFQGDGGAMKRLREISPQIPKWFRCRMLEIIGSHKLEYYQFNPATGSSETKVNPNVIYCGMAFNAVHKAIYTVYQTMAEVANLVKDDLLRSHTNSFVLKATMSRTAETEMLNALTERGFEVSCKGIGWAHFWDIDKGILGFSKPKGHIEDLEELRKRDGVYVKPMPRQMYDRWGHWLPEIPEEILTNAKRYEFVPVRSIPKVSPEKVGGYWRNDW